MNLSTTSPSLSVSLAAHAAGQGVFAQVWAGWWWYYATTEGAPMS